MYQKKHVTAALLMAGSGLRIGIDKPKQFHRINGKELYRYTVEIFLSMQEIDSILLVCHADWVEEVQKLYPNCAVIPGGKTRQESSYLAVQKARTDILIIHDAVRPFLDPKIIQKHLLFVGEKEAVNTCVFPTDTILQIEEPAEDIERISPHTLQIPKRSHYLIGQTPQTFLYPLIEKAHEKARQKGQVDATDDCSLVLALGKNVHTVEGSYKNLKVTNESDLEIATHLLSKKKTVPQEAVSLENKRYIVIGATGGIGKEVLALLAKEKAIAIPLSRSSTPYPIDLENPDTIKKALSQIYADMGEVDGLINTAGYLTINSLKKLSSADIEQLININLRGVIYSCKSAKIKPGGHIINFASSSFSRGRSGYGIYSACKAAVVNFTEALADEEPSLRINTLVPPRCSTKMRFTNFPGEDPKTLLSPVTVAESTISILKDPKITGSIIELTI